MVTPLSVRSVMAFQRPQAFSKRKCLKIKSAFLPWASNMSQSRLKTAYVSTAVYLILTLLIGIFVVLLPLNGIECNLVLNLQIFVQKTIGLQVFQVLTYLGDFHLWVILTSIYLLYAYFKSRRQLGSAVELAIFLAISTALTYFIKMVFARPRPN